MISYFDKPCNRCGSKNRVVRTWIEKHPSFNGSADVECTEIACTNDECQNEFDKNLSIEIKRMDAIKLKKEQNDATRKLNMKNKKKLI